MSDLSTGNLRRQQVAFLLAICLGSIAVGVQQFSAVASSGSRAPEATPIQARSWSYAIEPANPNANQDTRRLLQWMYELPKRSSSQLIIGQHLEWHIRDAALGYQDYVVKLQQQTGKWLALIGVGYTEASDTNIGQIHEANKILIDYWNQGGLVTIEYSGNNPWTGGHLSDVSSVGTVEDLLTPGTLANSRFMAQLDMVASGLAELRDAGVVVLGRQYAEMTFCDTSWWAYIACRDGEIPFKKLWAFTFDYLTKSKGLDNLLFIYAAGDPDYYGRASLLYPGDGYVDLVGADLYSNSITYRWPKNSYDALVATNKPFMFPEGGPGTLDGTWDATILSRSIKDNYPKTISSQFWHNKRADPVKLWALVDQQNAAELLADPWVITRDEVDWRQSPLFSDVPYDHPYREEMEGLYLAGYTAGCNANPLMYCPDATMNRAESSVFVERGIHSASYDPPAPTSQVFADLALDSWAAKWVNGLWVDQHTAGCGTKPLVYCPWQGHTRAEGCIFYLRMLRGANYDPPQPTQQTFVDVPLEAWYATWVQAAYDAGLIPACQTTPDLRFCPDGPLTRALAAYMMVHAKGLY